MIKVTSSKKGDILTFIFEARDNSEMSLDELDELYHGILGSLPRRGGYIGSNRFQVDFRLPDDEAETETKSESEKPPVTGITRVDKPNA